MKELRTPRLLLRAFQRGDLRDLYAYASDPEVGPMAGWAPHANPEISLDVLRSFMESSEVWAIVWEENHRVIGSVGLHADDRRTAPHVRMVGYALSSKYWGRGVMTEAIGAVLEHAFTDLHLDLISAYCYGENAQSARVLEKSNFHKDGALRGAVRLPDGKTADLLCWSILTEEYMLQKGEPV